jgi:hypothetical protein
MMQPRNRRAWIWLALAAAVLVSTARVQAGIQPVRTYAHSVMAYLAASQNEAAAIQQRATWRAASAASHGDQPGFAQLIALLPVFFVGLMAMLLQRVCGLSLCVGRPSTAPLLPFRFQRPPPSLLG